MSNYFARTIKSRYSFSQTGGKESIGRGIDMNKTTEALRAAVKQRVREYLARFAEQDTITVWKVWDRKSPRHSWRSVGERRTKADALALARNHKRTNIDPTKGWEQGQVGIEEIERKGGGRVRPQSDFGVRKSPNIQVVEAEGQRQHSLSQKVKPLAGMMKVSNPGMPIEDMIDEWSVSRPNLARKYPALMKWISRVDKALDSGKPQDVIHAVGQLYRQLSK